MTTKTVRLCGCCNNTKDFFPVNRKVDSTNSYPNSNQVKTYWEEISYTNNDFKNSILWGTKWINLPNNTLKYTINLGGANSVDEPLIGGGERTVDLVVVSDTIKNAVDTMMADFATFTNLQVENVGVKVADAFISINFLDADNNSFDYLGVAMPPVNTNNEYYDEDSVYTSLTESFNASGNTYLAYRETDEPSYVKGGFWYAVMLHELGHSLGLSHPHDNGGNSVIMAGVQSAFNDFGTYNSNMQPITVMSYNDYDSPILQETIDGDNRGFQATFGPLDIEVLQYMYGVNATYNSGHTTYQLSSSSSNTYWTCIYDSGGINTIDASLTSTNNTINISNTTLNDNAQYAGVSFTYNSFGGITIAKNSNIHNVINSSNNDTITGNSLDNEFTLTNGGNDTVNGGAGFDIAYLTNISFSQVNYAINLSNGVRTITNNTTNETIKLVNIERIEFSDKTVLTYSNILETGTMNITHKPKKITLNRSFNHPIVICGDPTYNGKTHCIVRILKITKNSFTVKLQESFKDDKKHRMEKVAWIVGEKGTWSISNTNKQIIFGNFTTSKTTRKGFNKITFNTPFLNTPIVLTQVATNNGKDLVVTRTNYLNKNSFHCSMQESDGLNNKHKRENIHWCAISQETDTMGDLKIQCGRISRVNHKVKTVHYHNNYFTSIPNLLTKCSSYRGKDLVNTRIQPSHLQFRVRLQEDKTKDNETKHVGENVDFIAIG